MRVQSMITCDTMDTQACIRESLELAEAGCEIVRITAPTVKDARNLAAIREGLQARGCHVPLVADIHFKPDAALESAKWVDKVRVNPGNYADSKNLRYANIATSNMGPRSGVSGKNSRPWSNCAGHAESRCASGQITVRSAIGL